MTILAAGCKGLYSAVLILCKPVQAFGDSQEHRPTIAHVRGPYYECARFSHFDMLTPTS